jgi:hypothetical protein
MLRLSHACGMGPPPGDQYLHGTSRNTIMTCSVSRPVSARPAMSTTTSGGAPRITRHRAASSARDKTDTSHVMIALGMDRAPCDRTGAKPRTSMTNRRQTSAIECFRRRPERRSGTMRSSFARGLLWTIAAACLTAASTPVVVVRVKAAQPWSCMCDGERKRFLASTRYCEKRMSVPKGRWCTKRQIRTVYGPACAERGCRLKQP